MADKQNLEIRIPDSVHSMKVHHVHFLLELKKFEDKDPTDAEMCRMNALFIDMDLAIVKRFPRRDNKKIWNEIVESFGHYQPKEKIPAYLIYDGKKYTFRSDFTKFPTDWFIDYSDANFELNPIDLISFCYIEEGLSYGEVDEHSNIINPRADRNKVFKEHLPLDTYLDIEGFFLRSWNVLEKLLTQHQKGRKRKS